MEADIVQLLLPITIISFACMIQGITGFGAGLVSMSLLPLIWTIPQAVGILSPIGVILTIMLTYKLRAHVQLPKVKYMFFSLPFGTLVGLWLLTNWPNTWMKAILGLILVVYVVSAGRSSPVRTLKILFSPPPRVSGGSLQLSGWRSRSPYLDLCDRRRMGARSLSSQYSGVFAFSAIATFIGLLNKAYSRREPPHFCSLCAGNDFWGLLGNRLARHLPQEKFRQLVMLGLLVMGVLYLTQWLLSRCAANWIPGYPR